MKKPIIDEKFYITDIPKDREKTRELLLFLGQEESKISEHFIDGISRNADGIIYSTDDTYAFSRPKSEPKRFHLVITYNDLMANYLPKDTVLNEIADEALKEVTKNEDKQNKYKKQCKGIEIDIYDILKAFNVVNPAIQHAIKKLLAGGQRGYKDIEQDYNEAIQSIQRGIELDVQ